MKDRLGLAMQRVGTKILECRKQGLIDGKWEGTQFKAAADLIADEYLRKELSKISNMPIVSEEDISSQSHDRPSQYWLIDPIDGTASFAQGFDGFVCQAARIKGGKPCLASVYAPALERLYVAEQGNGATVNGRPISVKLFNSREMTLIDNYPQPNGITKRLFHDLNCVNYVESGSIGLKICLVAEGSADIFVKDVPLRDWDVAAPHLVLQEAGGVLTQFTGESFEYQGGFEKNGLVVASSPTLLREIQTMLTSYM